MTTFGERLNSLGQDESRTYRIGLMGGTFDPIHMGHLSAAQQALDAFDLDGVLFIPAGQPVFKRNKYVTPAVDRVAMCRLACSANSHFDVATLEVERDGDTFAVDTLQQLHDHFPDTVEFYYIIGADAVALLPQWRDTDKIALMTKFIAVTRPGFEYGMVEAQHLKDFGFDVSSLEVTDVAISSSLIRQRVAQGHSIRYLTPRAVEDYILAHGLYEGTNG